MTSQVFCFAITDSAVLKFTQKNMEWEGIGQSLLRPHLKTPSCGRG